MIKSGKGRNEEEGREGSYGRRNEKEKSLELMETKEEWKQEKLSA